jgi:uncharacterized protein (DUF2147 family)
MEIVRPWLALTALLLTASPNPADEVLGTWLRDNGALQIKFEPCGDAICGNIVWVKPGSDSKAKVGQRLFFGMQPTGANSWTGKAANPDSGSIYSGKMSVDGSTLSTSGCVVGALICKSANWRRVPRQRTGWRRSSLSETALVTR